MRRTLRTLNRQSFINHATQTKPGLILNAHSYARQKDSTNRIVWQEKLLYGQSASGASRIAPHLAKNSQVFYIQTGLCISGRQIIYQNNGYARNHKTFIMPLLKMIFCIKQSRVRTKPCDDNNMHRQPFILFQWLTFLIRN